MRTSLLIFWGGEQQREAGRLPSSHSEIGGGRGGMGNEMTKANLGVISS